MCEVLLPLEIIKFIQSIFINSVDFYLIRLQITLIFDNNKFSAFNNLLQLLENYKNFEKLKFSYKRIIIF
jgi:hypothetical protein